jgi:hypothetical protein
MFDVSETAAEKIKELQQNTGTFVQNVHSDSRTSVASGMHVPHGRPGC